MELTYSLTQASLQVSNVYNKATIIIHNIMN